MSQSPNNPYAAPQAELQPRRSPLQNFVNGAAWSWLFVFVINLPVAVALGWGVCSREGRWGMLISLAVMLGFSTWLISTNRWYRMRMIIGGVCVAVSQFLPLLHIIAGAIGMKLTEAFGLMPKRNPIDDDIGIPTPDLNLAAAIFLTLFVGFVLQLAALVIGSLFRMNDSGELPVTDDSASLANVS